MLDVDRLIEMVAQRPALWNKRDPGHLNKQLLDKHWTEIGAAMGEDEGKLRKKWKYLRDQFPVELGKAACHAEDPTTLDIKWPYFRSLMFLKDFVKPRKYGYRPASTFANEDDTSQGRNETQNYSHNQIGLKRKREEDNDEHLYFFRSLIPHIRKIPPHKLLSFRSSIQKVVEEFAYPSPPNQASVADPVEFENQCNCTEIDIKEEKLESDADKSFYFISS